MKHNQTVASVLADIAALMKVENGYLFQTSELQAHLDQIDRAEETVLITDEKDILELLEVEFLEASHFDELPETIRPQMIRNAYDLGVDRAVLLLQAALSTHDPRRHIVPVIDEGTIALAELHADTLSETLTQRRVIFDRRLEEIHGRS